MWLNIWREAINKSFVHILFPQFMVIEILFMESWCALFA